MSIIAMTNSGSIRTNELHDEITMADILEVFPFENSVDYLQLQGSTIRAILEKSALLLSPNNANTEGSFMQVSGI